MFDDTRFLVRLLSFSELEDLFHSELHRLDGLPEDATETRSETLRNLDVIDLMRTFKDFIDHEP